MREWKREVTQWIDADSWMDVVSNFWIGIVLITVAAVPSWLTLRNHKSIKDETKVIRAQLVNGHKEPMRVDLDKVLAAIDLLSSEVRCVREDLSAEEDRRRAQIVELRDELHYKIESHGCIRARTIGDQ